MQFHLIVVSFSVAHPGEVARRGPIFFCLETGPPSYLRVWINAPQQIRLSMKLWYETQSICVEEGRRSFKSLPDYHFRK